ncbi:hypothetical protein HNP40_000921 [Mycobacteroides chelonae]|nr:hypothetical protein [Mycobacteroides chelonae]
MTGSLEFGSEGIEMSCSPVAQAVVFLAGIGPQVDRGLSDIRVFCVIVTVAVVAVVGGFAGAKARRGSDFLAAAVFGALSLGLFWFTAGWAFHGEGLHQLGRIGLRGLLLLLALGFSAAVWRAMREKNVGTLLGIAVSVWALLLVALKVS